ncbi:hypothetical protein FF38_07711 [Lucilia cuprina]|uniref:Uncharacterized protein n=1 Tax=Lucilia cuprina TaxID=7375 RepID=A0A0L0BKV1_LUCCU|nr:hypothetical protein FF38_07711 [Lucilia cuprina]
MSLSNTTAVRSFSINFILICHHTSGLKQYIGIAMDVVFIQQKKIEEKQVRNLYSPLPNFIYPSPFVPRDIINNLMKLFNICFHKRQGEVQTQNIQSIHQLTLTPKDEEKKETQRVKCFSTIAIKIQTCCGMVSTSVLIPRITCSLCHKTI